MFNGSFFIVNCNINLEIVFLQQLISRYLADRPSTEGELAGGYRSEFGYHRAINDALCGLFFSFDIVKNYIDQRT